MNDLKETLFGILVMSAIGAGMGAMLALFI